MRHAWAQLRDQLNWPVCPPKKVNHPTDGDNFVKTRADVILSVGLSIGLSRVDCDKTRWCNADILKGQSLCSPTPTVVGGRRPLLSEICIQSDPSFFEKRRPRPIYAYNILTLNRKR